MIDSNHYHASVFVFGVNRYCMRRRGGGSEPTSEISNKKYSKTTLTGGPELFFFKLVLPTYAVSPFAGAFHWAVLFVHWKMNHRVNMHAHTVPRISQISTQKSPSRLVSGSDICKLKPVVISCIRSSRDRLVFGTVWYNSWSSAILCENLIEIYLIS